jgi:hypothetical protein
MSDIVDLVHAARRLSQVRFVEEHRGLFLVRAVPPDEDDRRDFQTAVMGAETDEAPAAELEVAGWEVQPLRKRPGGAFEDRISIGRTRASDIVVRHAKVSKFHAYFTLDADGLKLTDARSKNGTFLDARRLEPNRPVVVAEGSEVGFGPCVYKVMSAAQAYLVLKDLSVPAG